jgi:hypothetical protein
MSAVRKPTPEKADVLRNVTLSGFHAYFSIGVVARKGTSPTASGRLWLTLRGKLDKPIRQVSDIEITLHGEDELKVGPARPLSVGAIVQVKPHITIVLSVTQSDFDRLWTLASDTLACTCTFRVHDAAIWHGLVTSVSFSNEPIEK